MGIKKLFVLFLLVISSFVSASPAFGFTTYMPAHR